jgi:dTDP-4-dehydrorhamnose 3,5-epimerase
MIFTPSPLAGAYLIDLEKKVDDRGFFARVFCAKEFSQFDLVSKFCQINNSFSAHKGTLRGMHYQIAPKAETKLIRCVRGSFYDMILDLREASPTFGHGFGVELSAENRRMMYLPKGFAHGILTLMDDTEMIYLVDEFFASASERVIRYNDPKFALRWPQAPTVISDKDRNQPDFDAAWHLGA